MVSGNLQEVEFEEEEAFDGSDAGRQDSMEVRAMAGPGPICAEKIIVEFEEDDEENGDGAG